MVTDQQVRRLRMLVNREENKAIAAAKAGMTAKTARKYLKSEKLPGEYERDRGWRTRECPFESDWEGIRGILEINPGLEAKTIFEELQRRYPGKYRDGQLRTLQRRIKAWRAIDGPAKEVFFPQNHRPGELGEFDFTNMNGLGVTISKVPFNHMIGHFVLTYSNWETGSICYSESYESLSECLQRGLWELGAVPLRIRTDRLSSAVHKECNPEEFTVRYTGLLKHYGATGEKTQAGRANENGDVEQRHNRFKKAVEQALMLRGSKGFASIDEYELFLKKLFTQLNAGRKDKLMEEYSVLKPLPCSKMDTCSRLELKVGPSSTINVKHNTYSVDSRLRGERIKIRVYACHIEIWYAQKKIESFPRMRGEGNHRINYRHIIEWLVRKPGAFENYKYREDLYPNSYFRMAYDNIKGHKPHTANKEYLKVLYTAHKESEEKVETAIRELLEQGQTISAEKIESMVGKMGVSVRTPEIEIRDIDLKDYDDLLCEYTEEAATARNESLSYEEFLRELLRVESQTRQNRRRERLLRASKIPVDKNIDSFEMKRLPGKAVQQVKTLLTGAFIGHAENVLVFGNPGSGKTHLLCAIGQEMIMSGKKVYFTTCSILVQELLRAKRTLELPAFLKKLSRYEALIIDEIGYVQQDREEMEVLFTLLAERYERSSIMLSSNFPFSKWEKIFKDPMVTAAAIDRLVHHSVIIELNLPSYRMDHARKNAKPKKS